jgi:hypothetical protein
MPKKKVIVGKNPRLNVEVSNRYTAQEKRAIAQDIRDYIIERSRRGLGPGAKPWSGKAGEYSEEYKNSLEFRIGGKSPNRVDLTLSSEMLDSLRANLKSGKIQIDLEENVRGKAEGNIRGTYGKKSPIPGKQRNFLEMTNTELRNILANYPLRGPGSRERREETIEQAEESTLRAEDIVRQLMSDIDE